MSLKDKMPNFNWGYFGGAECSYQHVVRKIMDDPNLSQERKDELIEDITYLSNHILSDCDSQTRNNYSSAYSSGIKWMKFTLCDKPSTFFGGAALRDVAMQAYLNALSNIGNCRKRIMSTATRLESNT